MDQYDYTALSMINCTASGKELEATAGNPIRIPMYLPCFSGFYGTWWSITDHNIDDEVDWDKFDNTAFENNIGKLYTQYIHQKMAESLICPGMSLDFIGIDSPKEYNFRNDRIKIEMVFVNETAYGVFVGALIERTAHLRSYIHNKWSSRDGFISFVTPNLREWWLPMILRNGMYDVYIQELVDAFLIDNDHDIEYFAYDEFAGNGHMDASEYIIED